MNTISIIDQSYCQRVIEGYIGNDANNNINCRMDKKSLEHFEDSYDEAKLSTLKKEIALPKSQLFQLVNDDDKFADKLRHFNLQGYRCIQKQQFYQAIVYLNQAELTLQYAASCGKTIERSLIITTLHNEACVYQRIWQLQKSADYIEGIIYNITSFLETEDHLDLCQQLLDDKSLETQKLSTVLQSKMKLVSYYLQFCAVSSQLKRHQNSLNAASKSLDILKEICEEEHQYESYVGIKWHSQLEKNILLELRNIKDFKDQVDNIDKNVQRFLNKAKKSIGMFQKKIKFNYNLLDARQKDMLQQFSIGSVMQIYPMLVPETHDKRWLKQELTPLHKIYKALYISIAHFTMATQLRLIAGLRYNQDLSARKNSTQFKSSQLHHLIAVITVALYVPYETVYFQHILNSYKNHYQVDLTIITESTLSQEMSHTLDQDDEIHLQISSLYRKKHQEESTHNQKSSVKLTQTNLHSVSPSLHDQLKRSKPKVKSSKMSQQQHNSVKIKCKMIADSQKRKDKQLKQKSTAKSQNKKSKSRKKPESRNKETLQSPLPHKKSPNLLQPRPPVPSRSKSKPKKKSSSKPTSEFSSQKYKKQQKNLPPIRSEHEYGCSSKTSNGLLTRTNKVDKQKQKKSLRSSERRSELKKSEIDRRQNGDIRFIRQGKSPNNVPKPIK